jgi:hypothetical protein
MTEPTMAERKYELLAPDRDVQFEVMRERMAELGDTGGAAALDAMFEAYHQVGPPGVHPVAAFVDETAKWLRAAMADLGLPADRIATACVGTTLREDVSAQTQPFADGSGLVLISDAVLSLVNVYGSYCGASFQVFASVGPVRRLWRTLRAVRAGGFGGDPGELTGLLRYHNVNQRLYGLAAKVSLRSTTEAQALSSMVAAMAANFVVGHELAHHALGHESPVSGLSPSEHLPVCSDEQQQELEADLLAYRASLRAWDLQLADAPETAKLQASGSLDVFAALGAAIAMLVVECVEQGLLIRRGCTHPRARDRADRLLAELDPKLRQFAGMFLRDLVTATEAATDFSGPPFDWDRFAANERVETPLPPDYLRAIARFDTLQCLPDDDASRMLTELGSVPAAGASLASQGDAAGALSTWGVTPDDVALMVDRDRPLAFHTVVERLHLAFTDVPDDRRMTAAVLATKVVAAALD